MRSRQKNEIRSGVHPEDVTHPKSIVNDYDHCDWIYSCRSSNCSCIENYGYKKCENK